MATATKRNLISVVSIFCVIMLIVDIFPMATNSNKAEAAKEDYGLPLTYDAQATLYDYYTDNEIHDGSEKANGSDLGGFQDPYTVLNSKIANSNIDDGDGGTRLWYHKLEDWITVGAHIYTKGVSGKFDAKEYASVGNDKEKCEYDGNGTNINGVTYNYYIDVNLNEMIKGAEDALIYVEFYNWTGSGTMDAHTEAVPVIANYTNYYERYCKNPSTWENATRCTKRTANFRSTGTSNYTYPLYFGTFHKGDVTGAEDFLGYTDDTKPGYSKFYWGVNIAQRNDFTTSIEGLAGNNLGTDGKIYDVNGSTELPYFNKSFLEENNVGKEYKNDKLKLQFDLDDEGYYYYNSENANQAVYYENGVLKKGSQYAVYNNNTGDSTKYYGFFPFNDGSTNNTRYNNGNNAPNIDGNTVNPKLNMGFGLVLDIDFKLPKVSSPSEAKGANNKDIIFKFTGDDDVWVFVDGKLALDLGGGHTSASGNINFTTQKVTLDDSVDVSTARDIVRSRNDGRLGSKKEYTFSQLGLGGLEYDAKTEHHIKFFYMERGMIESNLSLNFNLPIILNQNNLTIKERTDFSGVNRGLLSYTVRAAEKDAFAYTVKNKGTKVNEVPGSGFTYPSYEQDISRVRDYLYDNEKALFTKRETETKIIQEADTSNFYLEPNMWDKDNAIFIAYMYGNGSEEYVQMDKVSDNLYKVNKKNYTNVIFLRCKSGTPANSDVWSSSNLWNKTDSKGGTGQSMTGSQNCVQITDWNNSSTLKSEPITVSKTVEVTKQGTVGNFVPTDSNNYNPVSGVVYELTDAGGVFTGKTNSTTSGEGLGSYYLMHDQSSYFTGQFKENSSMSVVQSNTLGVVDVHNGTQIVSIDKGSRNTADYYDTTVNLADKNGEIIFNKNNNEDFTSFNNSGGIYDYKNSDDSIPVDLTEEYVNKIRTGDLKIVKALKPSETSNESRNEYFTFQLVLTNVFGNGINVDDYGYGGVEIEIQGNTTTLSADGTFSIQADQTAVIKNIPVNTEYEVTEISTGYTFNSLNNSSQSGRIAANTELSWTKENTRKTGQLRISKTVAHADGTTPTFDEQNKPFSVVVKLTMPTGVNFDNYKGNIVKEEKVGSLNKNVTFDNSGQATFTIKHDETITLDRIPYGTTYTVTENDFDGSDGWTKSGEVKENTPVLYRTINSFDGATVNITNTKKIIPKTQYVVQKIWSNYTVENDTTMSLKLSRNNSEYGTYTFTFKRGAVSSSSDKAKVTKSDDSQTWTITFEDLEKADDSGADYVYDAEEVSVNEMNGSSSSGRIGVFVVAEDKLTGGSINEQITNTYSPVTMPESGGSGEDYTIYYVLFGTGAVMLSALAFFLIINKKRRYF